MLILGTRRQEKYEIWPKGNGRAAQADRTHPEGRSLSFATECIPQPDSHSPSLSRNGTQIETRQSRTEPAQIAWGPPPASPPYLMATTCISHQPDGLIGAVAA